MIKQYNVTVNGTTYEVTVESAAGGRMASAPVSRAAAAPVARAAAPTPAAAPAPAAGRHGAAHRYRRADGVDLHQAGALDQRRHALGLPKPGQMRDLAGVIGDGGIDHRKALFAGEIGQHACRRHLCHRVRGGRILAIGKAITEIDHQHGGPHPARDRRAKACLPIDLFLRHVVLM